LPAGTSLTSKRRSVPSGVTARKPACLGSASAPTIRSSSSLPGRMRMTPRPGPESSATSSSAKRSILPRRVATTTVVPVTGSIDTISSPSPTRATRRPARVVSERSGVVRKPWPFAVATRIAVFASPGEHGCERVALAEARRAGILHLAHALQPPVAREDDGRVLVHDVGLGVVGELLAGRELRAPLVAVLLAQGGELGADHLPALAR